MSSLNTNVAAMTALQTLNQTNKEMLVTQNRISTGLRVKDASDNAGVLVDRNDDAKRQHVGFDGSGRPWSWCCNG